MELIQISINLHIQKAFIAYNLKSSSWKFTMVYLLYNIKVALISHAGQTTVAKNLILFLKFLSSVSLTSFTLMAIYDHLYKC